MSTRVEQYAAQFEAVNDELIESVADCTAEQWRQSSASEGWPIGVVAHHVGEVNLAFARMVATFAAGNTYTPRASMGDIHSSNARHAAEHATVTQTEALDVLRTGGAAVAQALRGLSDEQLERTAGVFGGRELRVAQVVEWVVVGHTAEHLASIRATLGDRD